MVQATRETKRDQTGSRTSEALMRITTQAVSRLTTRLMNRLGRPASVAMSTESHCRLSHMIGSVRGASAAAIRAI